MKLRLLCCAVALAASPTIAFAQTYVRAGVNNLNEEGNDHSLATALSQAGDARYLCWASKASNTAPGDSAFNADVFRRDRQLLVTELVSATYGGVAADGDSTEPSVSYDGRFVAFTSTASNLLAGGDNNYTIADVFVRDMNLGVTVLASKTSLGVQYGFASYQPAISGDGRYVAFTTKAQLVAADTDSVEDIYVHDTQTQTTVLASVSPSGSQTTHACFRPAISSDGSVVAFETTGAHELSPSSISNGYVHIVVKDMLTGDAYSPTNDNNGVVGVGDSFSACISEGGNIVAFSSVAENLRANDLGIDCFWYDHALGYPVRWVSQPYIPSIAALDCLQPRMTRTGNVVAFVAGNDSYWRSVYQNLTLPLSGSSGASASPSVAAVSQGIVGSFVSSGSDLVPRDTNFRDDTFVYSNTPCFGHQIYCTPKTNGLGCVPQICAWGRLSVSGPDDFDVHASEVINNKAGILIWGTASNAAPFFGGTLCVQTPRRTAILNSGGSTAVGLNNCTGMYRRPFTQADLAANNLASGSTVYFQFWSRDPFQVVPNIVGLTAGIAVLVEP